MKVKSIKPAGKADVYNMEVKDVHNFIANGLVVHNCYDACRYFLMARPCPMRSQEVEIIKPFDPFRRSK